MRMWTATIDWPPPLALRSRNHYLDGEQGPHNMSSPRTKRIVVSILYSPSFAVAVAFTLRITLLWLSHYHEDRNHPRFEAFGLEELLVALSLAHGKGFFGPYPGYDAFTACLAPVYPFLWAIGIKLFTLSASGAMVLAQAMNCVFSAATCWPIFAIGKRAFGEKPGLASAWLWAFLPYAVLMPLEWAWDQSLAALLLALIVHATFALRESDSSLSWTGYGLLWAFAALTNPTLCLLLPFFLGWLIVEKSWNGGRTLALGARAVFIFVLALLPWAIRNYYVIDGWVFVKSNFGMELWLGNNPAVNKIYSPELHPFDNLPQRMSLILSGEPNYNREMQRQAIDYIESHPRTFLKNLSDRFEDTWAATYDSGAEAWIVTLRLERADVWFCTAFSVLSFAGLILALFAGRADSLLLAMCLLLFPIPYYVTHSSLRYRHPIDPFMTIFTVYAITRFLAILVRRPRHVLSDQRP
jgi:Dolichyl-phosphate-mannose-protein mannosyltransferase